MQGPPRGRHVYVVELLHGWGMTVMTTAKCKHSKKAGKRYACPPSLLRLYEDNCLLVLQVHGVGLTVPSLFKVEGQLLALL